MTPELSGGIVGGLVALIGGVSSYLVTRARLRVDQESSRASLAADQEESKNEFQVQAFRAITDAERKFREYLDVRCSRLEEENASLRTRLSSVEDANAELRERLETMETENEDLRGRLVCVEREYQELERRHAALREEHSALKEASS